MKTTKKSQNERIKDYLQSGKKLTPLQALEKFGCFRLSGRINDLRNDGHDIKTKMVAVGKERKWVAQYSLTLADK